MPHFVKTKKQAEIDAGRWIRAARLHLCLPNVEEISERTDEFENVFRAELIAEVFAVIGADIPTSSAHEMFPYLVQMAAVLVEYGIHIGRSDVEENHDAKLDYLALAALDYACGRDSRLGDEPDLEEMRLGLFAAWMPEVDQPN
jgi:hypothetical protein